MDKVHARGLCLENWLEKSSLHRKISHRISRSKIRRPWALFYSEVLVSTAKSGLRIHCPRYDSGIVSVLVGLGDDLNANNDPDRMIQVYHHHHI